MNETPSGNRWEPGTDDTAPVTPARAETPPPATPTAAATPSTPDASRPASGGTPGRRRCRPGPRRRHRGYALSSVGAGAGDDLGSHQTSDDGSFSGHGIPGADGDDDHADLPDGDGDEDHDGPDGDD